MILTQHYLACLSHASYLIGDETTGRAVVVDPRRDIGVYLEEAARHGLRIERVIETHIHADFLSGHLELAAETGAIISYGKGADVAFPVDPLHDGQVLSLGEVTLEILATPGHTPESICILVRERPDAPPHAVLTGDTLFVGDVGRPDLLASASAELSAEVLARQLYHSLYDRLLALPDDAAVLPAHGAGSSCGKALSSETQSTIGEQRRTNYALQGLDEEEFVAAVTEGQPAKPRYFSFDAKANRERHSLLDEHAAPSLLDLEDVLRRQRAGAVLLDAREPSDFVVAHLRGAVNVGLQGRFAEWAADVLPPDRDIVLVGDPALAAEARVRLGRVGLDRVVGQLADVGSVLAASSELVEASSRVTMGQLAELRCLEPDLQVVDVRGSGEVSAGVIPGAIPIPLAVLMESLEAIDPGRPVVTYCASGYRSQVAASSLSASGFRDVSDLVGGYGAWEAAGLPVERGELSDDPATVPHVSARVARAMLEQGALLLDVREPVEWAEGHAPGALLMSMGEVHERREELPADRPILVICRTGGRSAVITRALLSDGFDATNVAGGMVAWTAAGLPAVVPSP
jgi:rhodanese-related sulfurtransferase/glyoxylase-like metal-dependent hydrolase (beta-lactamase superfamily II)